MSVLRLCNINKIYPNGFHAVHDFSMTIEDGEFVVLIGPSGCGKSTLLRMIAGLEQISSGEFFIDGQLVNHLAPVDRNVAMVFQDYALYGNLTIYDNVGMSMRLRHADDVDIYDRVMDTSRYLHIDAYLQRLPGQLSGGQKQRVALGRSMVRDPKVFLMDEPLSNLDAKLRASTRSEISQVQRKLHTPTVYVTHDQTEAMTMADRIVVMKDGYVQQIGTPMEIYRKPENLFVAGFIGMPPMNFIPCVVKDGYVLVGERSFALPEHFRKPLDRCRETTVTWGIRPEQIVLDRDSSISLPVLHKEFLGSCFEVSCALEGMDITIRMGRDADVSARELPLTFDMSASHFYDMESGRLIV